MQEQQSQSYSGERCPCRVEGSEYPPSFDLKLGNKSFERSDRDGVSNPLCSAFFASHHHPDHGIQRLIPDGAAAIAALDEYLVSVLSDDLLPLGADISLEVTIDVLAAWVA